MLYTLTTAQVLYFVSFFLFVSPFFLAFLGWVQGMIATPQDDMTQTLAPAQVGEYSTEEYFVLPMIEMRQVRRTLHKVRKQEQAVQRVLQWLDAPEPQKTVVNIEYIPQAPTMPLKPTTNRNTMRHRINKRKAHTRATQWLQQHKGIKTNTHNVWSQLRAGRKVLYC